MSIYQLPSGSEVKDWGWVAKLEKLVNQKFHLHQSISLAFVDAKEITKLNARYRHKNKSTDVLSFNLSDKHSPAGEGDDKILGEVIICWPVLKKQAKQKRHSLTKELQLLLVHGTLHLLGYDHEQAKEATVMEGLEKVILAKL